MTIRQPSMLVVDDNAGFQAAADLHARQLNYVLYRAETLRQARDLSKGRHFNLVLLDLTLPDGCGLDLLDDPLDADHIAIVTGHPTVASARRAVGSRVSDYLVKPVASQELVSLMERMAVGTASDALPGPGDNLDLLPGRRAGLLRDDEHSLTFAVGTSFDQMQQAMLRKTLAHFGNDKTRTAKALGVSVKTVYNHLTRLPTLEAERASPSDHGLGLPPARLRPGGHAPGESSMQAGSTGTHGDSRAPADPWPIPGKCMF